MKKSIINDKYEKIKTLGEGSSGKVYLAKVINSSNSENEIFVALKKYYMGVNLINFN